MNVGEAVNACC